MPSISSQVMSASYRDAQTIALPDGNACFVRRGAGSPIILLHGAPLSLLTWRRNIPELSTSLDVIALDMKGFGRSSKAAGPYSPEAQVQFVLQLMEKLRLSRVSIAGSSYGCAVALTLARKCPEKVDRLVLINSVGYPGGRHSIEQLLRINVLRRLLEPTLRSDIFGRRIFAAGLRRSYKDRSRATPDLIDSYFQLLRSESGERSFLATLEEFDESRLAAIIPAIPHQTLIIWGAKDHILPVSNAQRFKREMQHAQLEIIADCGHLPHEEDPDRVNSLIARFLQAPATVQGERPIRLSSVAGIA
jgi:pimeloyl-ACP methyl ester carboxylesterase